MLKKCFPKERGTARSDLACPRGRCVHTQSRVDRTDLNQARLITKDFFDRRGICILQGLQEVWVCGGTALACFRCRRWGMERVRKASRLLFPAVTCCVTWSVSPPFRAVTRVTQSNRQACPAQRLAHSSRLGKNVNSI